MYSRERADDTLTCGVRYPSSNPAAPRYCAAASFGPRAEPFEAQAFVTEFAVEALAGRVLPRLARIDQRGVDFLCL